MMLLHAEITENDIHAGRAENCESCPAARSLNRALLAAGIHLRAEAAYYQINLVDSGANVVGRVPTPAKLRHWMREFDRHRETLPMGFDVDLPQEVAARAWGGS